MNHEPRFALLLKLTRQTTTLHWTSSFVLGPEGLALLVGALRSAARAKTPSRGGRRVVVPSRRDQGAV